MRAMVEGSSIVGDFDQIARESMLGFLSSDKKEGEEAMKYRVCLNRRRESFGLFLDLGVYTSFFYWDGPCGLMFIVYTFLYLILFYFTFLISFSLKY